jgi:His-Xaa-Ser system radical SAM maturase HxsC
VLHLLTNARALKYAEYARELADAAGPAFLVGVPLYSDLAEEHDFICQAKGAFDDCVRGLLNLHRARASIELRFVVHSQTVPRMVAFSHFVARNLPFVSQIAIMGLETVGFGAANRDYLWVDPVDIRSPLEEMVQVLENRRIAVALFNMQHCVLPRALWKYSRRSISDWKNEFLPICVDCSQRSACAGFFALANVRPSRSIRPIPV